MHARAEPSHENLCWLSCVFQTGILCNSSCNKHFWFTYLLIYLPYLNVYQREKEERGEGDVSSCCPFLCFYFKWGPRADKCCYSCGHWKFGQIIGWRLLWFECLAGLIKRLYYHLRSCRLKRSLQPLSFSWFGWYFHTALVPLSSSLEDKEDRCHQYCK